ncbi:WXG100 family type VII secretion target [Nocardia higoensis]|uniref:WXG100 family type VII secretion target n=1 Tax=Nocardia higoensis TaxID=228599 RepID=UPI0002DF7C7B|nr:hypothetical protein [Nocardia higoensis]
MSGHETPAIPGGGEYPPSWEHSEIVDAFEPLTPTDADKQAQHYFEVSELWDEGLRTFARSIQTSIAQAWSGPAAERSKESIQKYVTDAEKLTPVLNELSTRVTEAASAITQTKNALPDPVVITWTSWLWPPNRWDLQREQTEEEQAARDAMNNYYVQPFKAIDSSIPVLPTPVSPTSSPDITVPPGGFRTGDGGGSGDGSGGGAPSPGNPGGTTSEGDEPGDQEQSGEQQPEGESNPSGNADDSSTTPSSHDPAGTDPAGTTPASSTPSDPDRTVPSGSGPSSPGAGSPTSPGSGSPGSPGSSTPQPGRSIAGGGTGTPTTPGTSSTAAAASAGGAGRSGMGGMAGSPGSRGGGQDDESHKIPDYLITQQNTDELLGEVPPAVPGGVIGGEPA